MQQELGLTTAGRLRVTKFSLKHPMWLLNAKTLKLKHIARERDLIGKYAILSHTWAEEEVSFQDIRSASPKIEKKKGYLKVRYAARQAVNDGLDYVWIDTCCINKSDSAELSEAINSMYRWYYNAKVCYAYIADIPKGHRRARSADSFVDPTYLEDTRRVLAGCRWASRSWTLQELIAPSHLEFYNEGWQSVGSKSSLVDQLAAVTGVDREVLKDRDVLRSISIAKRLYWAANRQSTREEDQAYSLLGICDVHIPMLYGEGPRAFIRLQEEIVRTSLDHSIFAWEPWDDVPSGALFAPTPYGFRNASEIVSWTIPERDDSYQLSNRGLVITLPAQDRTTELKAILNCRYEGKFLTPIALRLQVIPQRIIAPAKSSSNTVCHLKPLFDIEKGMSSHLTTLSMADLHTTRWIDLVIARQKPPPLSGSKTRKIVINGTPTFPTFDIVAASPENDWEARDRIMSIPVPAPGQKSEAHVVLTDKRSKDLITLAFTQSLEDRAPVLRHCLVNHETYDEPRRVAALLLENTKPDTVAETQLRDGRKVIAKVQNMFLMGEMVWLVLLATAQ